MSDRLTAMDIENQEFERRMFGYDRESVDLFLRSVAEEFERLHREHGEMLEVTGQLRRDLEELKAREHTLQRTLVTAQRMSEEMKERAEKEVELIIRDARGRADLMLADARDRLTHLELDITRSRLERDTVERRLRSVLEQHLGLLDLRDKAWEPDNLRLLPSRVGSEAG